MAEREIEELNQNQKRNEQKHHPETQEEIIEEALKKSETVRQELTFK